MDPGDTTIIVWLVNGQQIELVDHDAADFLRSLSDGMWCSAYDRQGSLFAFNPANVLSVESRPRRDAS